MTQQQHKSALLEISRLEKHFALDEGFLETIEFSKGRLTRKQRLVRAVNDVSLSVSKGEVLCIVGESGCGKSTIARLVAGLLQPTSGSISFEGSRIDGQPRKALAPLRKKMQMIFQNPYASLNPRMRIRQALQEPVRHHFSGISQSEVDDRIHSVMHSVGVDPEWANRYPHEFSGGQRQRIAIARALTVDPEFIIADEPVSALDVSIQAQVLNLMLEMQEQRFLTYMFITHDLSVVEHFGTRVAVLYLGTVCELADTKTLFANPRHPYTKALLSAIPKPGEDNQEHIRLQGDIPTPINMPTGCPFHTRCQHAYDRCHSEKPESQQQPDGSMVACHAVEQQLLPD